MPWSVIILFERLLLPPSISQSAVSVGRASDTTASSFFEVYCLQWILLILEIVVCVQMWVCMPDPLSEVTNVILV